MADDDGSGCAPASIPDEATAPRPAPLLDMPPELLNHVFFLLSPYDLVAVSSTCRSLRAYALSDVLWQPLVQQNVPAVTVASPTPCASFYQLYAAFDRFWFLPKHKLWFGDREHTGRLVLVRYDQRRGCIEGYQLVAGRRTSPFHHWEHNEEIVIHTFKPETRLHLDRPVVQFCVRDGDQDGEYGSLPVAGQGSRFADEIPMHIDSRSQGFFNNLVLAKSMDAPRTEQLFGLRYPYGNAWPSPAIPAHQHTSWQHQAPEGTLGSPLTSEARRLEVAVPWARPQSRPEVSDQLFQLRNWIEMVGTDAIVMRLSPGQQRRLPNIHIGEDLTSYATLDARLYTPTPLKPWRGIWVGDYSVHGCEFLLVNQPDDAPATDEQLGLHRRNEETDQQWEDRRTDARIYRGRVEGIKLTGDINVPRGEYTFVVDDLGPGGLVRIGDEAPFVGARVVRSKGHIADTGFNNGKLETNYASADSRLMYMADRFIDSQLLLISENRLAHYWVEYGHVSFFERIDIDSFLVP